VQGRTKQAKQAMRPSQDTRRPTCDETRPTRLHYQLRCLLPSGHEAAHAWTPELLPAEQVRASA
jgi:hypothetical protein